MGAVVLANGNIPPSVPPNPRLVNATAKCQNQQGTLQGAYAFTRPRNLHANIHASTTAKGGA